MKGTEREIRSEVNCYKHPHSVQLCPPRSSKANPTRRACPSLIPSCPTLLGYSVNRTPCLKRASCEKATPLRRRCSLAAQTQPEPPGCPRAPAHWDPPCSGREAGAAGEKGALREGSGGGKGQTLKLPGCGLRARMLSVLPTSWQQQHGPGRRRRCGNGAARVAEPVFASVRPPAVLRRPFPRRAPLRGRPRGGSA